MDRPARTNRAKARRQHRTRVAIALVVALLVIGGGSAAWAVTRSSGPDYRLATVTRGTVAQTVNTVGTVSTVNQATVSFPVSGTVSSVKVGVGDSVTAGETIASLQTTALQQDVASENAAVASAEQTLASDEAIQDGTASTTTTTATTQAVSTDTDRVTLLAAATAAQPSANPGSKSNGAPGGQSGGQPAGGRTSISSAQSAVTRAQNALDNAITTQNGDVSAAARACSAAPSETTATSDSGGTVTGSVGGGSADNADIVTLEKPDGTVVTGTTSANPQAVAGGGTYTFAGVLASTPYRIEIDPGVSADCAAAVTSVANQQKQLVDTAEVDLKTALQSLTKAITALQKQAAASSGSTATHSGSGSTTSGSGSGTHTGTGGTGSGSSGSGGSGTAGGTTRTVTAEQIAADQKSIDAAKAELTLSKQNLDQATLTTPIAGKVAAVGITAGHSVSGGSTTSTITVLGTGQKQVTTTIGINDVDLVKKGQPVAVTVDGVSTPLTGTVSLIGIMNTAGTSGSTTTYPVTVVLDPTSLPLYDGAGASLAISVGSATNVLAVPVSAVHSLGPLDTVSVYAHGKVTTTRVTLGVQGTDLVQVATGLTAGERVVLANVREKVPSSTTTTGRGFGGAGLGGAGLGGVTVRVGGR